MPILRKKQIRKMTDGEIEKKINDLRSELAQQKSLIASGGAIENPSKIREIKKTIARLLTYKNLRRLGKI
ncbi:MAG: 50S ribosomal protein L29 [Promethearchaeota archaeon]|nr:MAG: 50S ribosomal protein L29 [Candidatus Lokiarchaeota archaeon]